MTDRKNRNHRVFLSALALNNDSMTKFAQRHGVSKTAISYVSRGTMKSSRLSKAIQDYIDSTDMSLELEDGQS